MKKRVLKIYEMIPYNNNKVPLIRLQGKWLEKIGFIAGMKVEVKAQENMLIIKPIDSSNVDV